MKHLLGLALLIAFAGCKSEQQAHDSAQHNSKAPKGMVYIPAGTLSMGGDNDQADSNEYPKHDVEIDDFYMNITEVTNADYKAFVDGTGYLTVAERPLDWEEMKKQLPPNTPAPPDSVLLPWALVFTPTDQPVPLTNPQ